MMYVNKSVDRIDPGLFFSCIYDIIVYNVCVAIFIEM